MKFAMLFVVFFTLAAEAQDEVCMKFLSETSILIDGIEIKALDVPGGELEYTVSPDATGSSQERISVTQLGHKFYLNKTLGFDARGDAFFVAQVGPRFGDIELDNSFFLQLYGGRLFCSGSED